MPLIEFVANPQKKAESKRYLPKGYSLRFFPGCPKICFPGVPPLRHSIHPGNL
jgi:hypothetical protein